MHTFLSKSASLNVDGIQTEFTYESHHNQLYVLISMCNQEEYTLSAYSTQNAINFISKSCFTLAFN